MRRFAGPGLILFGFVAMIFLAIGFQVCGNVYTDVADKRAALLAHDTVPSGVDSEGNVTRADMSRDYTWSCTSHFNIHNVPMALAGLALVAVGVILLLKKPKTENVYVPKPGDGPIVKPSWTCRIDGTKNESYMQFCAKCGNARRDVEVVT